MKSNFKTNIYNLDVPAYMVPMCIADVITCVFKIGNMKNIILINR